VSVEVVVVSYTIGAALLALWSYVRWPGLAPQRFVAVGAHVVGSFLGMALMLGVITYAGQQRGVFIPLAFLALLLGLVYVFLAAVWMLRLFAEALGR
jgi:hypothetical protein